MKLQQTGIGVKNIIVRARAVVESVEQPLGGMPGSLVSRCHKPAEILSDLEYAATMEECYGIREEGVF